MPTSMDVQRLIAEVRKRPTLWDVRLPEYKDRTHAVRLWLEIADIMGCDVEQCKRKWKNLRDAYRAEVRRAERRIQRLKSEGQTDPQVVDSKWIYFQPLNFMNDIKRKRYSSNAANTSSNDHSNDSHDANDFPPELEAEAAAAAEAEAEAETEVAEQDMDSYCNVKMEPQTSTDDEADHHHLMHTVVRNCGGSMTPLEDDDDEANERLFEQFKSVATPQAARRLSGPLTMGIGIGIDSNSPTHLTASSATTTTTTATTKSSSTSPALASTAEAGGGGGGGAGAGATSISTVLASIAASNGSDNNTTNGSQIANCKCAKRTEDQVHFLEDLEREEQLLMQSTRRDITRANNLTHFGDSDYNFLVSFLPQMKRLNELQNLQFRAKMSDLMLRIMAHPNVTATITTTAAVPLPVPATISTTMTTTTATATPTPCQQHHFDCTTTPTQCHYRPQSHQKSHEKNQHL